MNNRPGLFIGISIHAPVKGATDPRPTQTVILRYFNPRTREGCDNREEGPQARHAPISIHAPVKGATYSIFDDKAELFHFNPRTREGCDNVTPAAPRSPVGFQSTHP